MNCQEAREHLPALIDNELAPAERAEVERHLETCSDCREEKRRQEQFTTKVKTSLEGLKPSDRFVKNVLDRLDAPAAPAGAAAAGGRGRLSLVAALVVLAAALVAAGVIAAVRGQPGKPVAAVVGCEGAWLAEAGSSERGLVPAELTAGARLETGASGKAVLRLSSGAGVVLGADSCLELPAPDPSGGASVRLEKGTLEFTCPGPEELVAAGQVSVRVGAGAKVRLVLSGGRLVAGLERGSAALLWGTPAAELRLDPGETWAVPADGSAAPEKAGTAAP